MTDSQQLLAEYARNGSDAAFRELVTRYVDLVYSTALRLVERDTHRAEDVAQTVFVDLARLARTLPNEVMLGGWLHQHTCFVAANTMRGERRRQSRERQAVEMNALQNHSGADFSEVAPMLDEAITELGEADRTAILLRFFEQRDFRSVGQVLGSSEDAARMRVTRALEKLAALLKHRGVTASSSALAVVLGANAVQAAPVGLAVTISTAAAMAGTTLAATATTTAIKITSLTTMQKALITAAIVAAVGTGIFLSSRATTITHSSKTNQMKQSALEVLEKFIESRNITTSYIVKAHEKCTYSYTGFNGVGTSYEDYELRSDGNRCRYISSKWGDINLKDLNVGKERADYYSTLWDGEKAYCVAKSVFHGDGRATLKIIDKNEPGNEEKTVSVGYKNSCFEEMNGFHWGDQTRIDELFLKSDTNLQLLENKSNVHGVDCYVIKADVPGRGKYTVWIDPVHDFHIASIRVQRKTGGHIQGILMTKNCTSEESYDVLGFEKAGNVWYPKAIRTGREGYANGHRTRNEREVSVSMITLNPDHDALKSFIPDDVPNGCNVSALGFPPSFFTWRDGKVVDKKGKVIMDTKTGKAKQ